MSIYRPKANPERIKLAIKVMERVRDSEAKLNMSSFQTARAGGFYCDTEEEIKSCGTAACFSGWLAVSPEAKELGFMRSEYNNALTHDQRVCDPTYSMAKFFGVKARSDASHSRSKIHQYFYSLMAYSCHTKVYPNESRDTITIQQVLDELYTWLKECEGSKAQSA